MSKFLLNLNLKKMWNIFQFMCRFNHQKKNLLKEHYFEALRLFLKPQKKRIRSVGLNIKVAILYIKLKLSLSLKLQHFVNS